METRISLSVDRSDVISVIVPVYNAEEYLEACLDSILAQTWPFMEIVVVDDGSSDESGIIADRYAEMNPDTVRVLHQQNSGVSTARINGMQAAEGGWIGFVDADDIIEKDMYERLIRNAIEHKAMISHCGYQTIVHNGERIHYFYNTGLKIIQNREDGVRDLLEGRFIEPGLCNKLFHRTLIQQMLEEKQFNLTIRYNEDLLLNYLLFRKSECSVYEDFCPYHYMARIQTATRNKLNTVKYSDPVKVWRFILQETPADLRTIVLSRYIRTCFMAYAAFLNIGYDEQTCNQYKKELLAYKEEWHSLRFQDRLRINLIVKLPVLYRISQEIYVKVFQKKRYE